MEADRDDTYERLADDMYFEGLLWPWLDEPDPVDYSDYDYNDYDFPDEEDEDYEERGWD